MRLLEDDRVVDDRRGLFAHAIEQPAMVVAIEARRRVVHGQRADDAIAEEQRAHSADWSVVGSDEPAASRSPLGRALTSGRRLRATHPVMP